MLYMHQRTHNTPPRVHMCIDELVIIPLPPPPLHTQSCVHTRLASCMSTAEFEHAHVHFEHVGKYAPYAQAFACDCQHTYHRHVMCLGHVCDINMKSWVTVSGSRTCTPGLL
jgi:hypothetical protein